MIITEYSLENIPWLRRNIPWSNQILFSKGPTSHARIPWRIFHGYHGIFPGEYSMVKTEYSLVKSNFIFQGAYPPRENSLENIPWLQRNIPWRIFHGWDGIFPGQIKFYFPRGPPPRENSLENIPWLQRNILWSNQILFSKEPPPHARIPWRIFHGYNGVFPGEYSMF